MNFNKTTLFLLLALCLAMASCTVVKPHERAMLKDPDMMPGNGAIGAYADETAAYREGSRGGDAGKSGGGCGCY